MQTTCDSFFYQTKVSLITTTNVKCHKSQPKRKEKRAFKGSTGAPKQKKRDRKKTTKQRDGGQCFFKVIGSGFYEDNPLDLTSLKRLTIFGMMSTCHCG